ncbi:MAG: hypothetical protein KC621_35140, partial [Myxococcales bacterium]|nr:hypothetical protein [Myxococcales bacterium]
MLDAHPDRAALTRVFPVFGLAAAGSEPSEQDRQRAGRALRDLVGALTQARPAVLVIDDAQWGDLDSADLLASILSPPGAPRALVLATRRTDTGPGPFLESIRARVRHGLALRLVEHVVAPLGADRVDELLDACQVPEPRRPAVVAAAGGNPFLLSILGPAQDSTDVEGVIRVRVDALPVSVRPLVWGAAAAGAVVPLGALARACRVPVPSRRDLARLADLGLVRASLGTGRRSVVLAHDGLRAVVLQTRSDDERRRFLGRLADELLALDADDPAVPAYLLEAGRSEEAAAAALRAVDAAEAASAFGRVAQLLDVVLRTGTDDPDGALRERQARALRESRSGLRAAEIWSELAADPSVPAERARFFLERAGEALLECGQVERGLTTLEGCLVAVGEPGLPSSTRVGLSLAWNLVKLLVTRGRVNVSAVADPSWVRRADACWSAARCVTFFEPAPGLALLFRSLDAARRGGDSVRVARVQGMLAGTVLGLLGPTRPIARRWLDAMEALGRERGDDRIIALALLWSTLVDLSASRFGEVVEGSRRALTLLDGIEGAGWERNQAASFLVRAHTLRGDHARCAAISEVYRGDARRRDDLYAEVLFGGYATLPAIARGDHAAARRSAEWLRSSWMPDKYTIIRFYANVYEDWCDLLEGAPDRAGRRLVEDAAGYRSAGLHRIVFSRVERAVLEARVGLAGAGSGLRAPDAIAA